MRLQTLADRCVDSQRKFVLAMVTKEDLQKYASPH